MPKVNSRPIQRGNAGRWRNLFQVQLPQLLLVFVDRGEESLESVANKPLHRTRTPDSRIRRCKMLLHQRLPSQTKAGNLPVKTEATGPIVPQAGSKVGGKAPEKIPDGSGSIPAKHVPQRHQLRLGQSGLAAPSDEAGLAGGMFCGCLGTLLGALRQHPTSPRNMNRPTRSPKFPP